MPWMGQDITLNEFYDEYPRIEEAFKTALDESLNPSSPELLYEIVAGLNLPPGAHVVDLGCGEGGHTIKLAERFGFTVTGVDPVSRHIELSNSAFAEKPGLRELVAFERGEAEAIPVSDASTDLIWCREVLMHVKNIGAAAAECHRVLKPGRHMLIYQVFSTDALEPEETNRLWMYLSDGPTEQTYPETIENAFASAGFETERMIVVGSEWGERMQEDSGQVGRHLLHAARLLRDPQRYIKQFGRANYDIKLADCFWHVYRMIGKLSGRIYLLRK